MIKPSFPVGYTNTEGRGEGRAEGGGVCWNKGGRSGSSLGLAYKT